MYQSVGCEIIDKVGECLDKPLLRREISGKPLNKLLEYNKEYKNDEVEDMYLLMKEALEKYPEIEAVCSGAIMSTYQKNRVDSISKRLNIKSISPLWEINQELLLNDFIKNDVNAILLRVCCMGLNSKHIGKSLSELKNHLIKLQNDIGANCCGEGGEFESLVLDCPIYKKSIKIIESEIIIESDDDIDQVARLLIKKVELIKKYN